MIDYTSTTLEAERLGLLNGLDRGEVIAWLTAPTYGQIEKEWDDNE